MLDTGGYGRSLVTSIASKPKFIFGGLLAIIAVRFTEFYFFHDTSNVVILHNTKLSNDDDAAPDIHFEDSKKGHQGKTKGHVHNHTLEAGREIAIGGGITSKGTRNLDVVNIGQKLPIFSTMLPSFCRTASEGFHYNFYFAYDHNDAAFSREDFLKAFDHNLRSYISSNCPHIRASVHFVQCSHAGKPAWAQNDAMMEAYLDGMDYFYRINDDTVLETRQWTEKFIETLARYKPKNVGVVGPRHRGGNEAILTYDFTHRTHVDVFGFYYPRLFSTWWADDWITQVYPIENVSKRGDVRLRHMMRGGTRYNADLAMEEYVGLKIRLDQLTARRYIKSLSSKYPPPNGRRIISMSLYGAEPRYTMGALRNAQLRKVYMPEWTLRIYVPKPRPYRRVKFTAPPPRILDALRRLDVQIVELDTDHLRVPPMMWRFLVADDMDVDYFIVRDCDSRLTDRNRVVVNDWVISGAPFHCVRDHPSHSGHPVSGGLWGGRPKELRNLLSHSFKDLMMGLRETYMNDMKFLQYRIWRKIFRHAVCHDSISCDTHPSARPFPVQRSYPGEHMGGVYDINHDLRLDDINIMKRAPPKPQCTKVRPVAHIPPQFWRGVNDTAATLAATAALVSSVPVATTRRTITTPPKRYKYVFWNMDTRIGPMRDIRSILEPYGVSFIEQNLSGHCAWTESCASGLRVISRTNAAHARASVVKEFQEAYMGSETMRNVTHFVATAPVSMAEFYLAFNKPIIVIATGRYEQGRYTAQRWKNWNTHLKALAAAKKNIVAANNQYDVEYIKYFTGITPYLIPNLCSYVQNSYKPLQDQILLLPINNQNLARIFFDNIAKDIASKGNLISVGHLLDIYPQYIFSQLTQHPAAIFIPSDVTSFVFTELYRMNIPVFVPSIELLQAYDREYKLLSRATFNIFRREYGETFVQSPIQGLNKRIPDPNSIQYKTAAFKYWLKFADYYQWPHVETFESVDDLVRKLQSLDLTRISENMREHNAKVKSEILSLWETVLDRIK